MNGWRICCRGYRDRALNGQSLSGRICRMRHSEQREMKHVRRDSDPVEWTTVHHSSAASESHRTGSRIFQPQKARKVKAILFVPFLCFLWLSFPKMPDHDPAYLENTKHRLENSRSAISLADASGFQKPPIKPAQNRILTKHLRLWRNRPPYWSSPPIGVILFRLAGG